MVIVISKNSEFELITGAEYVDAEYEFEFEFEFEFGNELDLMGLIERDGEMVCPAPFCLATNLFKVAAVSLGIGLLVVVVVGYYQIS